MICKFQPRSLQWSIIPALLLIQLLVFGIIAGQSVNVLRDIVAEQTRLRAHSLQTELQAALIAPLLERDFVTLQEIANELTSNTDIAYLLIRDSSGKTLASAGIAHPDTRPLDPSLQDNPDDIYDTRIRISQGEVQAGLYLTESSQILGSFIKRAGPAIVLGILMASAWMIWVTLTLARRLKRLSKAAAALEQGDLQARAPSRSRDEIGRLGEAFNRMAAAVQAADENWARSQRFTDMLLMTIPIPVFYKDGQGRFLGCNAAFTRSTGFSRLDIRGKTIAELWPESLAKRHQLHDAELLAGENHLDYPATILTANGQLRHVILSKDAFYGENGEVAGIIGAWNDITEQHQAEERLRLLASVFKHSHDGIIITDARGRLIDVNNAGCHISGYSREELLGHPFRKLHPARHERNFYRQMREQLQEHGYWQGEIWNRHKHGHAYPLLLSTSVIREASGKIRHFIAIFADISLMKAQEHRLAKLAHHDPLTQLPNRVLLAERMKDAIKQAQQSKQWLAVCFMDLDGFKEVNDRHGHTIGDQLLIQVAERLQHQLAEGDTLARLGGDEFVLLISGLSDLKACRQHLQRLLDCVAQPYLIGQARIEISASIGVTLYPQDEQDPDTLLRHADQAMYQAKENGRNGYQLFDAEHDRQSRCRQESLSQLLYAMQHDELSLYYQPKVNMRQGTVVGAEALMRWQHPEKGLLTPGHFLPDVEGSELDITLGEWVIRSALKQMQEWLQQGLQLPVSVNISPHHLQQDNFAERLHQILSEFPSLPAGMLEIEILESTALKDIARVSKLMTSCRELGVEFSLDDFGTGYSSLLYLKRLPAGKLKIDQSFIRDMHEDGDDLAIVQGIIGLSDAFNRSVVAEGVECIEHGSLLLHIGCDYAQGFGIARPMPAESLLVWATQWRGINTWQQAGKRRWSGDDTRLFNLELAHRQATNLLIAWLGRADRDMPMPDCSQAYRDFDNWYYGAGSARFGLQALFLHIGQLHQQIHTLSERILTWCLDDTVDHKRHTGRELQLLRDELQEQVHQMLNTPAAGAGKHGRQPSEVSLG